MKNLISKPFSHLPKIRYRIILPGVKGIYTTSTKKGSYLGDYFGFEISHANVYRGITVQSREQNTEDVEVLKSFLNCSYDSSNVGGVILLMKVSHATFES